MMMRNLICPSVGIGIGAYIFHCKEAAQTLKASAQVETPFSLRDERRLDLLAGALGVSTALPLEDLEDKAIRVAEAIVASLSQDTTKESRLVSAFGLESRKILRGEMEPSQ
jgi:hydroxylamine reductase (hybrid-cluster protein)